MKVQTFSIVIGDRKCDAHCPFCVSKMTGFCELPGNDLINEANFQKAARLAQIGGTTTVLMTGKGEPTFYMDQITRFLKLLQPFNFPFIELQTNGLKLGRLATQGTEGTHELATIMQWRKLGLNTIALSVVDVDHDHNAAIYNKDYPDLANTIRFLHKLGFSVRLCVMMLTGMVDSPESVARVVDFCRTNEVEQLTIRPIRRTAKRTSNEKVSDFVADNGLEEKSINEIREWVRQRGTLLFSLMHGAEVFDIDGQNLCVSDCLTVEKTGDDIRTLIFYVDGRLTYDWQYPGAILLGGRHNIVE